ncbi:succinate--CoA ligase subunit alpha [Alkalihalobacillus sp. BA299]|uniref:succinate--CoA ligase subunit alpha n=1 Tax=Alkalihalobacillus sp. BA299 TaxID=2815938 RepID=UPI0027DB1482|nr:succinate--CoA ligase subunit alpha [Alkalihalobacillus sp. BA299]
MLINEKTRVLVQGLTSNTAKNHALNMVQNNTKIIAGVVPTKGGTFTEGWPIYDTVRQTIEHHDIDLSLIYAPPKYAAEAIIESIEAEINLIVCVTEGIPLNDMLDVYNRLINSKSILVGPCSPGLTSPGKSKVGFIPDKVCLPGNVGVIGKSGTLTYEICYQLRKNGLGQSTIIGIGGDPIKGLTFRDAIELFEHDNETDIIVMVGEIGGRDEEIAAEYVNTFGSKPVIAYIAGKTAPEDVQMGHAGAMISHNQGGYEGKVKALKENGIHVAHSVTDVSKLIKQLQV